MVKNVSGKKYRHQTRMLAAIDCVIFGFDGQAIQLLLVRRSLEPEKGAWSLAGGFIQPTESADEAAARILYDRTGLRGMYLEQFHTFSKPDRDPVERTLSIAYFSLIDISKYQDQLSTDFQAEWFPLTKLPRLVFDHASMVHSALEKLRYKAALHPILFELLPAKFTLPQLQCLFECVYQTRFDKRNLSRKILSSKIVVRQTDKDKSTSRKGAYFYKLNSRYYRARFQDFLHLIPLSKR